MKIQALRLARRSDLKNFSGIGGPCEPPENPQIRIDTTAMSPEQVGTRSSGGSSHDRGQRRAVIPARTNSRTCRPGLCHAYCFENESTQAFRRAGARRVKERTLNSIETTPQLLARAAEHQAELDSLYRSYRHILRRYIARTFGPGPPDPEDVVQAAFERFAASEQRVQIGNPKAWLVTSARNYVFDQRRRQVVRAGYVETERATADGSDDLHAERVLEGKERWAVIESAIRGLDACRREVLIMSRLHGLSSAEIARRNRCSATLVKVQLAQALLFCERALREAEGE